MAQFRGRILITGFGIVAQALLPLLLKHLRVPCERIAVIEFAERPQLRPWRKKGVRLVRERVTPPNLGRLLGAHVGAGDLIVDLTWSIDFFSILQWAREHDVLYANASLESWDPADELDSKPAFDKSLYSRYAQAIELVPRWRGAATAVCDHGTNPGLISHFVKQGLLDIAAHALREHGTSRNRRRRLERFMLHSVSKPIERLLKFAEPTLQSSSSTMSTLLCTLSGCAPSSSGTCLPSLRVRQARR